MFCYCDSKRSFMITKGSSIARSSMIDRVIRAERYLENHRINIFVSHLRLDLIISIVILNLRIKNRDSGSRPSYSILSQTVKKPE